VIREGRNSRILLFRGAVGYNVPMKIRVVVEYDPDTKAYAAFCPELPGCASCGDTEAEALQNVREAIVLYLEPTPVEVGPQGKVIEVTV
jgi:predicted RNase H-like HicB family nuclease